MKILWKWKDQNFSNLFPISILEEKLVEAAAAAAAAGASCLPRWTPWCTLAAWAATCGVSKGGA